MSERDAHADDILDRAMAMFDPADQAALDFVRTVVDDYRTSKVRPYTTEIEGRRFEYLAFVSDIQIEGDALVPTIKTVSAVKQGATYVAPDGSLDGSGRDGTGRRPE